MPPASPPSSVPASPRFEWSKIGSDWEVDGSTVIASGMLADERYAVGSKVVRSGKAAFTYTINKVYYPDAHMFLGVAEITDDPEKAETWAFSPTTANLYNGHKLNEHGDERNKVHLMADPKADLTGTQEGAVVTCFVDYDEGTLKFSANGEDPIDSGVKLPESGVRPWVFLVRAAVRLKKHAQSPSSAHTCDSPRRGVVLARLRSITRATRSPWRRCADC